MKIKFWKNFLFIHVISYTIINLNICYITVSLFFLSISSVFALLHDIFFSFIILKFKKRDCNLHNTPSRLLNPPMNSKYIRLSTKKLSWSKRFLILYRRRSIINNSIRKPDYMNLEFTGIGNLLTFYWVVVNCNKKGNTTWSRVGYDLHVFHTVEKWMHVQL